MAIDAIKLPNILLIIAIPVEARQFTHPVLLRISAIYLLLLRPVFSYTVSAFHR